MSLGGLSESELEREFPQLRGCTYLDHAGATLYSRSQLECVTRDLQQHLYGNPHSRNAAGAHSSSAVQLARCRLLQLFDADPQRYCVVFTSGATAALALVADLFQFGGSTRRPGRLVYLQESHTSVVGMRGRVRSRHVAVSALPHSQLQVLDGSGTTTTTVLPDDGPRRLCILPAQCNFSGRKNPLQWVHNVQSGCLSDWQCTAERQTTDKSVNGVVASEESVNGVVTSGVSVNGVVASGESGNGVVTSGESRNGVVTSGNGVVTSGESRNGVTSGKVENGLVTAGKSGNGVVTSDNPIGDCAAVSESRWYCMLDAASFAATDHLDLSRVQPDFVCISFYKMFGYPTGLGALLVRRDAVHTLQKSYFGGGTVAASLAGEDFQVFRDRPEDRLEDGTVSYLAIMSVVHGLETVGRLAGDMSHVGEHVFRLAQYTYRALSALRHYNGAPVVQVYSDTRHEHASTQGGVVSFNVLHADGRHVGYSTVEKLAAVHDIVLRTGCFCNSGACQRFLGLSSGEVRRHHAAGHQCGDAMDVIAGRTTGAVRASFGYMSRQRDADRLLQMIGSCFVVSAAPARSTGGAVSCSGTPRLAAILVYPVKSCGAVRADTWPLDDGGLLYDRQWVVTVSGVAATQKRYPRLCLIRPRLLPDTLLLTAAGQPDLPVPLSGAPTCGQRQVRVCGQRVWSADCGETAADWLCRVLCVHDARLLRHRCSSTSLANQSPLALINLNSVRALLQSTGEADDGEQQADEWAQEVQDMADRFRANLVLDGVPQYAEERMSALVLDGVGFPVRTPTRRCQVICVQQNSGHRSDTALLALHRAGTSTFGVYLDLPDGPAQLTVNTHMTVACQTTNKTQQ